MGRKDDILAKVRAVCEPLAAPEGLELVDVELTGSGRTTLRLYIDRLRDAEGKALPRPATSQVALGLSADAPDAPVAEDDGEGAEAQPDLAPQGAPFGVASSESSALEFTAPGEDNGVSLDDCTHYSRICSAALDVEDPLDGAYDLEVSSPGLDRPLRKPEHFSRYAGEKVRVKTYGPIAECQNRKTFVGKLQGYRDGKVLVDVDGTVFAVPLAQISKANVEPEFDL